MKEGHVFLVEDDPSVRRAIARVLRAAGHTVEVHSTPLSFLEDSAGEDWGACCVVVDVTLPGMSGLDLQEELKRRGDDIPLLFVTGHANVANGIRAMKSGALDYLLKPIEAKVLLAAVERALDESRLRLVRRREHDDLRGRVQRLTPREREVFDLVVVGYMNKQVGATLGASEKTVKVHRARVMEKMRANSLADLVRMADRLGIPEEVATYVPSSARQARMA